MSDEVLHRLVEALAPLMDTEYCQPFHSAWELDPHVPVLGIEYPDGEKIYEEVRAAWNAASAHLAARGIAVATGDAPPEVLDRIAERLRRRKPG